MSKPARKTALKQSAQGQVARPSLLNYVQLKGGSVNAVLLKKYALRITEAVKNTIQSPVSSDPVARQYIPQIEELQISQGERPDPIGDRLHSPVKGVVHRYPDRALLKLTNVCAVYCRYCFRKEMIGPGSETLSDKDLSAAFDYIRNNKNIWEVILTGGDPLILSPRKLHKTLELLSDIKHVQTIRIHTRVPVADPKRITNPLCQVLNRKKPIYMAVHINHVQEISPDVEAALSKLHKAGCVLLSQSVLLKDVNDNAETLEALFKKLITLRVKPYYIHHPDLTPGTSHFRLSIAQGQAIMKELQGRMSGICMPHYMLDIPDGHGKIPLSPCYLENLENERYLVENYQGHKHHYPPKDSI